MRLVGGDDRTATVTLVRTPGPGSMNYVSQRLAEHIRAPVVDAVGFRGPGDLFGARAGVRGWWRDRRIAARLRAVGGPVHLVNHHFARYGLALDQPYVVTVHDAMRWIDLDAGGDADDVLIARPPARDRARLEADRAGIRRAAALIAVSEHAAGEIAERFGVPRERIAVVPNGIDHDRLVPDGPRRGGPPYVLFVGSEHPRKNLDVLLLAFAELRRARVIPGLRLVKVGAPGYPASAYRPPVERLVRRLALERDVVFAGHVPDDDVAAWYRGAGCLVLPSRGEGFGLPVIEAMACGCPVVTTTAGALPEVAGGAAVLVDPGDVRGLVAAIAAVLTDPGLRAALRARGLERARHFTWASAARGTEAVYRRVLDRDRLWRPAAARDDPAPALP